MMGNIIVLSLFALFLFWLFDGFRLFSMGKRAAFRKNIRPVYQSPERDQLLQKLQTGQATGITQIDALLLTQAMTGKETWPEIYHNKYPDNVSFTFLYAHYLICKGWVARGGGPGDSVTSEGAESFIRCLTEAKALLKEIIGNEAVSEDCYAPLLVIYKGLSQLQEAADFYTERAPHASKRLDFHLARLGQITPRWDGDMDEVMKLGRDLFAEGGAMTAMLAAAWFEYYVEEDVKNLMKCIKKAGEKEKLIAAFKQLKKTPQVINDREAYNLALAHNCFAVLFYLCKNEVLAREAFEKTSGFHTHYPWMYISRDVAKIFYDGVD